MFPEESIDKKYFDEKSQIVIGNLVGNATPLVKPVITAFSHKATISANTKALTMQSLPRATNRAESVH